MKSPLIIGLLSSTLLLGGCAGDGYQGGGYDNDRYRVRLDDLIDMRGRNMRRELRDRGFRKTGGYKENRVARTTWYNKDTRQCIEAIVRQGRVDDIETINENNCL